MKYRQCRLRNGSNRRWAMYQMTYLPSEFGCIGKRVKLRNNDGEWEDGWEVIEIGPLVDEICLPDYRKEIRAHRRTTGDSLPKEHK